MSTSTTYYWTRDHMVYRVKEHEKRFEYFAGGSVKGLSDVKLKDETKWRTVGGSEGAGELITKLFEIARS